MCKTKDLVTAGMVVHMAGLKYYSAIPLSELENIVTRGYEMGLSYCEISKEARRVNEAYIENML